MRVETRTCDRCGATATEVALVTWAAAGLAVAAHAHDMEEMDLCPRCAAELRAWCDRDDERRDES